MALTVGSRLGHYDVPALIGEGGFTTLIVSFGIVWTLQGFALTFLGRRGDTR